MNSLKTNLKVKLLFGLQPEKFTEVMELGNEMQLSF